MRFSTTLITAALASPILGATLEQVGEVEQQLQIPAEAVLGTYEFKDGEAYAVGEDDAGNHVLIIFAEEVDIPAGTEGDVSKRWAWKTWRWGSPMTKREDGEIDQEDLIKRWGWKTWRFGSPMTKREDEEVDKRWGWKTWRFGSPMTK